MEPIRVIFTKEYMHPWLLSYYIDRFSTLMARFEISMQIPQVLARQALILKNFASSKDHKACGRDY